MKKEDREFLKKVEKLVYEQMKQKHVNCDTVCESLGMTNQSLRRKILAITGQTGGKYLLTIRMNNMASQAVAFANGGTVTDRTDERLLIWIDTKTSG